MCGLFGHGARVYAPPEGTIYRVVRGGETTVRSSRRIWVAMGVAALIVAALALFILRRDDPGVAPAGQPAVAAVDVDRFRQAFNAAAPEPRLLVLLSPT